MYFPSAVFPYQRDPGQWYTLLVVIAQTVTCSLSEALSKAEKEAAAFVSGIEPAEEMAWILIAVGPEAKANKSSSAPSQPAPTKNRAKAGYRRLPTFSISRAPF